MRRLFSAFPLNITRKLFLINLLVLVMFSGIAGIITVSQKRIEQISTRFFTVEFEQVIKNADWGRKLSDLKNRTTLLIGTFYGNENIVDTEGRQLVNDVNIFMSQQGLPGSLKSAVQDFEEKLKSLLERCSRINSAATKINTINMEINMLLRNIEGTVSENAVQAALSGKKDPLARLGTLIPSCRETLLEISVCFVRIDPLYGSSLSDKSASIPGAINELYLRLGTIPLSSPAVEDMVRQITDKVTLYKEAFTAFDQAGAELRRQVSELNKARGYTTSVMERMDMQIINNAGITRKKNVDDMRASLVWVYFLCGFAVILFGSFTYFFFLLTFRRPMARICEGLDNIREGNLDTTIRLDRQDEWHFIEDAMNEMVSELRTSYSTLYDKNCQLAEAHQELESYMKELTDEIVERKRMEEALRESNQKFRSLSENAPDIIYTLGSNYAFTYVNPACEKVLGYKNPEIIGRFFTEFVQEDDSENYDRTFRRISEVRETIRHRDVVMAHRDGDRRIFNMSGAPNFDTEGRFSGIVGILKDITEYRQLQVQIQQAQRMESISTLAGGVAHDFNNLMMGIQGRVSLMLIKTDINHPHFKHLKGIEDDIRRAADMTQQLLGFSRTRKNQISLLNLNEVIKKQNHLFGRTKREITIREKYDAELWPVEVDQSQIEQVFLNLYINAWQAMPGGGTLYVRTENTVIDKNYAELFRVTAGHYVKISVTDTGVGMDEATQKRIFEPFFTTKEFGKGTGLGLFSTYSIVRNHDGFIHVYSEPGKGSKFTIYLPAARYTEAKTVNIPEIQEDLAVEAHEAN